MSTFKFAAMLLLLVIVAAASVISALVYTGGLGNMLSFAFAATDLCLGIMLVAKYHDVMRAANLLSSGLIVEI